MPEKEDKAMTEIKCRKCSRLIGETNGDEICFRLSGNFVCVQIRGKSETVRCDCGYLVRVKKNLALGK